MPVSNPGRGEIRYMYVCCNVPMALPVSVSQRGSLSNSYEPWLSGKLSLKIQVGNAWQLCCLDISVLNIQGFLTMKVVWLDCPFLVVTIKKFDHIVWSTFLISDSVCSEIIDFENACGWKFQVIPVQWLFEKTSYIYIYIYGHFD